MDRFQALFELSPIAQEEYDAEGRMVRMNRAALELFGVVDASEFEKMNLFDNPHLPPGYWAKLQAGEVVEWDLEYSFDRVKFGTQRMGILHLHATIFPIPDDDGKPGGYLLQTLDLSERRRASAALAESAELHSAFIENIEAGWFLFDSDMKVVEYRDTSSGLVGLKAEDVVGRYLYELTPNLENDRDTFKAAFESILNSGEPLRLQHQHFPGMEPGSQQKHIFDLTAFRVVLGGLPHVACFITDTSRHRRLQDQLVQAQKMESIGRLASGIAHDFNNLLAGILGNASLMEINPDDPGEVSKSALEIKQAAQQAADLTSSMLSFSRRSQPRRESTSIAAVVHNVAGLLERAKNPGIRLETDIPEALPMIEADQSQLESVVMNLFVNAVDAMPGGGTLRVGARVLNIDKWRPGTNPAVGHGKWIKLTVMDTGHGMDAEAQSKAFEPFFTTKGPRKGTGLGLYSVYGIVQNHGGQITLSSEPDKGTTFDLYFPVVQTRAKRRRKVSMGMPVQGHGTVLVVDDDRVIRQTLSTMLSSLGYKTISASGGREALDLLRSGKERIDLVMLDIVMEDMDGAETFRRIRKMREPPHVLLMSGQTEQMNVEHLIQSGARGFLPKPFTLRGLSRKVRFALQG